MSATSRTILQLISTLLLSAICFAQNSDASGFVCPDRGCKQVGPTENVSQVINSCGSGISFTLNGITYTPSDDKCPAWVEYVPTHTEPDHLTPAPGKMNGPGNGTYDVKRQLYHCVGWGCGWFGLEGCCEPNGDPTIENTLPNCAETNCVEPPRPAGDADANADSSADASEPQG